MNVRPLGWAAAAAAAWSAAACAPAANVPTAIAPTIGFGVPGAATCAAQVAPASAEDLRAAGYDPGRETPSPTRAFASRDGAALAVWTETTSDGGWRLQAAQATGDGHPSGTSRTIAHGQDGRATAPSIVAMAGGRFVVAWGEATYEEQVVYAMGLDSGGRVEGPPATIAPTQGTTFGAPRATLDEDDHARIVFVAYDEGGFEVMAAPLACPP